MSAARYDAIVVGAGAGGGVAAAVLAEAGKRVLLLERGPALSFAEVGRDHLRNQRFSQHGHNAGPALDGNPRVATDAQGKTRLLRPHEGGYHNNAAIVGGGTRVYGAQAWRFLPNDFRMASTYGVPEGSSLADWPLDYDELAPYYERAEWELGVSGNGAASANELPRERDYPMPPLPPTTQTRILRRGADALGWATTPVPLLINSVPHDGRDACIRCQHCVGFACPVDAKNGAQNTVIPRALATGNCELVTNAMVTRIATDGAGRASGVDYLDRDDMPQEARAEVVILAAGAVETARLLLNSATDREPTGIGNSSDQVGRHLQGHAYTGVNARFAEPVYDGLGPGVSIATLRFNHGNDGIIGGGMLADEFVILPIIFQQRYLPPNLPRWGAANKTFMREAYRYVTDVKGPIQEIPSRKGRVTVDPDVRDRYGLPVARFSGTTHPETIRTAQFIQDRAREWVEAAGAIETWSTPPRLQLFGGQHQAGTCRMGDDPRTSVVDRRCRVHGHDNLFVADGSPHVTNGGVNPVLTILALAYRTAEGILRAW
ncbi:MAG TPA: GMC family oxidoreductase [Thermomicrobiales bacterium]|jgi:choline dehydrogenase-like flavoprotein